MPEDRAVTSASAGSEYVRAKDFEVPIVVADTLRWAREQSGKTHPEVARKLGVDVSLIAGWEQGGSYPTLAQLERLAILYRRCLAALLLKNPPNGPPPPAEYRTLPERHRHPLGEEVFLAVRRARGVQASFAELSPSLDRGRVLELPHAQLDDDPKELAEGLAALIGLNNDRPSGLDREVLRTRINAVEAAGVLVLQLGMPVEQSRAFSVVDGSVPVIVLNARDGVRPRSFSLFHELAHILLDRPAVCGTMGVFSRSGLGSRSVEAFCNQFAASILAPAADVLATSAVRQHGSGPVWEDSEIAALASRFRVSRQVALRRLLTLELTDERFFKAKQREYELQAQAMPRKRGGGGDRSRQALRENGLRFTSLVLDAYRQDIVTPLNAADMLGVKYKHFSALEVLVSGVRA